MPTLKSVGVGFCSHGKNAEFEAAAVAKGLTPSTSEAFEFV